MAFLSIAPNVIINEGAHVTVKMTQIFRVRECVKHTGGKMHDSQGVLKSAVGCAWVEQICHGEVMDVPQSLHRARIYDLSLICGTSNETMYGVSKFVGGLGHYCSL
jgi:hypothetical protein